MISFLYNKYNNCIGSETKNIIVKCIYKSFARSFFYFCNTILIFYYRISQKFYYIKRTNNEPNLIISLTSFPKRINTTWIAIESLIRQTIRPDMIILWLAEEQFPNRKLPVNLVEQQKRGLSIRWCDNLMSHKKYFYVCQEFPEANIITADDDMIYPPFFVSRLLDMHAKYPNDVVSLTSQTISPTYCTPPSQWCGVSHQEIVSSFRISINSGAGVLFPPHSIPAQAFDKRAIKKLCPYADDLWLTVMTHVNGVPTTKYSYNPFPIVIKSTLSSSLCAEFNSISSGSNINNDTQWAALINEYRDQLKKIVGDYFE